MNSLLKNLTVAYSNWLSNFVTGLCPTTTVVIPFFFNILLNPNFDFISLKFAGLTFVVLSAYIAVSRERASVISDNSFVFESKFLISSAILFNPLNTFFPL